MIGTLTRSVDAYAEAFDAESVKVYPAVDAIEARTGYAIAPARLLPAARILACPLKIHAPNWQHGRVIYALLRERLAGFTGRALLLDIGTAKGFSALCAQLALDDAGVSGTVVSVDVINPTSRELRNTVAELDQPKTLTELLAPWPEASAIRFLKSTGIDWLRGYTGRIEYAFVDGKHDASTVKTEALLLAGRQQAGDLAIFDDMQLPELRAAVMGVSAAYAIEFVSILPHRAYAIARRR